MKNGEKKEIKFREKIGLEKKEKQEYERRKK